MRKHRNPLWERPPLDYAKIRSNIMSILAGEGEMDHTKLCDRMNELHGHSSVATRTALKYLQQDGYVEQEKQGKPWKVVMRGVE